MIPGKGVAHIPQENSAILSELTPVDMSNWSLNSDTCINAYIDMGLLSGHLMRIISFLTHHTSPHSPPPPPHIHHSLTGCIVPPATMTDLASCTMLLKCTEGLRRRNRRLDTNSCPRAKKRGKKKDDYMLYCFV